MRIIGFDPGTARVGWSVVIFEKSQIRGYAFGCFETSKTDSEPVRLLNIYTNVRSLLSDQKPDTVSIEALFYSTNATTAIPVGQARGVLLLACAQRRIPVVSYSPTAVKRAITGDGKATKKQVQFMVTKLLKLAAPPQPDDAADAVAIALTHAYTDKMKTLRL